MKIALSALQSLSEYLKATFSFPTRYVAREPPPDRAHEHEFPIYLLHGDDKVNLTVDAICISLAVIGLIKARGSL